MRDEARDSTHVVSRALVLSNGALGAEGQCLGLARALGFHDPEVHLVGEAALALAPRFSSAWSEKVSVDGARDRGLALSVGAAQMVRRARRRVHPMPRAHAAAAKLLRLLPASLHVQMHALWERVFGALLDEVWVGADLAEVTSFLRNREQNSAKLAADETGKLRDTAPRVIKPKTLVLASGRGSIPAAAAVKRRHKDDAFVLVTQHPRVCFSAFDAVVAPKHDFLKRHAAATTAVIETEGALHRFDESFVEKARESWRFFFSKRPAPRLAVAIGGPTRLCSFGAPETFAAELVDEIENALISTHFKSACVAFSNRTSEAVKRAVEKTLHERGLLFLESSHEEGRVHMHEDLQNVGSSSVTTVERRVVVFTSDFYANAPSSKKKIGLVSTGPNLYAGAMAWADGVLVTADSCSMLSEAVSLNVPVFVSKFKEAKGKMSRFLASLATRGKCVDAATVFKSRENQTLQNGGAAADSLASFVWYRRSIRIARDTGDTETRLNSGDLQTVAARVRELVEVRAHGRQGSPRAEPSGRRRLEFDSEQS